jgi:hypothetical protein
MNLVNTFSRSTRALLLSFACASLLAAALVMPSMAGAFGQPALSAGDGFSCALNDSGHERCWGSSYGDTMGFVAAGSNPAPIEIAGGLGAVAIANANSTNCALIANGTVRCWGQSYAGELGRGVYVSSAPDALPVTGISNATQIGSAAGGSICARLADATAKCWGAGTHHELGDGGVANQSTPVPVAGLTNIQKIVAGSGLTCALIVGGTVRCWGQNSNGEIGNNTSGADVAALTQVSGLTDAVDVGVGYDHVCALRANGTVVCWGDNFYGQLGNGDLSGADKHVPTAVSTISGVKQISVGGSVTCALLADSKVSCWGFADTGETGTGTVAGKVFSPTAVPGVANVERLPEAIGSSVCVMQHGGAVVCWGGDEFGGTGFSPLQVVTGPKVVPGLQLISARNATGFATVIPSKPKLDKKRKNFTLVGRVDATPDPIVLQSLACTGTVAIVGSYKVVTHKTTHKKGKKVRKKVIKTKKFNASAPLAVSGGGCAGAFSVKFPAKTVAKKKLKITSTFAGNEAMLSFTAPVMIYTMPKLPKPKKK